MKRRNKVILVGIVLIILVGITYFSLRERFERYISRVITQVMRNYGVNLNFTEVVFRYFDQSITFKGVGVSGSKEGIEFEGVAEELTLKFRRVISNFKDVLRRIEVKNAWIKLSLRGEKKERKMNMWFLNNIPISCQNVRFELFTNDGEYRFELVRWKHAPKRGKWHESAYVKVLKAFYRNKVLGGASLNISAIVSPRTSVIGSVTGETDYGIVKKLDFEWVNGEGLTLDTEFHKGLCLPDLISLCSESITFEFLMLKGVLKYAMKVFEGNFKFGKLRRKNVFLSRGEGRLEFDINQKVVFLRDVVVEDKDASAYVKGKVGKKEIDISMSFLNLPFEKVLYALGIRTRVFAVYSGNVTLKGSFESYRLKGSGDFKINSFAVCRNLYPMNCGDTLLYNRVASLTVDFKITDERVLFDRVYVRLPDGSLTAYGEINYSKYLDLTIKVNNFNISHVSPISKVPMGGYLTGDVYIRGPFQDIIVYYSGDVHSYSVYMASPGNGKANVYYRYEKLYYSFSNSVLEGKGLLEFDKGMRISHVSSFRNLTAQELSTIIGLPKHVTKEVTEIEGSWSGSFFIISDKDGKPLFSATLKSESGVDYLGEKFERFYAEGFYHNGVMEYGVFGDKGGKWWGYGGYKNHKLYLYTLGSGIRTDRFSYFANELSVSMMWSGTLNNNFLTYIVVEKDSGKVVGGVLDNNYHLIKINPSRGVLFWGRKGNLNSVYGCVEKFNVRDFVSELKNVSSNLNVCGYFKIPAYEPQMLSIYPSWIKIKDVVMEGGSGGDRVLFSYRDTWINLQKRGVNFEIEFNLPVDFLSGYLNVSFSEGKVKGKLEIPLDRHLTLDKIKGAINLIGISARLPFVYIENVSGIVNIEDGMLTMNLKQEFPAIKLAGVYDFQRGSTNGYLVAEKAEIKSRILRGSGNLSIRWFGTVKSITIDGKVRITEGFIPFKFVKKSAVSAFPSFPVFLENLNVSFDKLSVKGSGVALTLAGNLVLKGNLSNIDVDGEVGIKGKVSYMGKEFEIKSGRIIWYGEDSTPFVEILASTEVEKKVLRIGEASAIYTVYLDMKGTPPDLLIELYSSPPLTRENIFSLLFTGKTIEDIYATEVKSEGASAQLSDVGIGMILGEEFKNISRVSGLDVFSIYPRYSESLNRTTTYIRVGKNIRRELWMEYSRDLNFDEQEFLLIWKPSSHIIVRGGWDNTYTRYQISSPELGNLSFDLIFSNEF